MKFLALLIPSLLALSFLLTGCGKIELPSDEEEKADTTPTDTTDIDKSDVVPAGTDTLTVAEVLSDTTQRYVLVRGYIVGYYATTGTSSFVFGMPSLSANKNMLLADSPEETDVSNCIAAALTLNGNRDDLNLYDHPENYKRRIAIYGLALKYFGATGVNPIVSYTWCATDSTPNTPDTPDSPTDSTSTPTIDPQPQDSIDGRTRKL